MNVFNFTGNLGMDAESRYTQDGTAIVSFSVAVKSGFGEKAKTSWARCSMFGKRGESVAPYLMKGQLVGVSGELTLNEFTNKDGNKQQSLEVRVNDLTLLGKRDENSAPRSESKPTQKPMSTAPAGGFEDMADDIPF